jgi:hypothetical protein
MLKEDEIKDVNVIPQTTSLKMAALTVTINPTGGCNGKIRITHHDHIAALFREKVPKIRIRKLR